MSRVPLIFDPALGMPRPLRAEEAVMLPAGLGAYGTEPPATPPVVTGPWHALLDQLCSALVACGLLQDLRAGDWNAGLEQIAQLAQLGPYQDGRLITGSLDGWQPLDPPPPSPGAIQVPVAQVPVAQAPLGLAPVGLAPRGLAYRTILGFGPEPPTDDAAAGLPPGALWFTPDGPELLVWNGSCYSPTTHESLRALAACVATASGRALLLADGCGGAIAQPLAGAEPGSVLSVTADGDLSLAPLLHIGPLPPWPDGSPAPLGPAPMEPAPMEPAPAASAIWLCTAPGAEAVSVWHPATARWRGSWRDNPVLDGLAALRQAAPGSVVVLDGDTPAPLTPGGHGDAMVIDGSTPSYRPRLFRSTPDQPAPGDLRCDDNDDIAVFSGDRWVDASSRTFQAPNATGGDAIAGMLLTLSADGWTPMPPAPLGLIGVALAPAAAGAPLCCALTPAIVALAPAGWAAAHAGLVLRRGLALHCNAGILIPTPHGDGTAPFAVALAADRIYFPQAFFPGASSNG